MRRFLLLCFLTGPGFGQQDDAAALLLHVREKVRQTMLRLPKYLCTETIDRRTFEPEDPIAIRSCNDLASRRKTSALRIRKTSSDRLRLDVAISNQNEMYSWVGEARFQDRSLADMVRSGALSTGEFGSFLQSIFETDAASFSYNGDVQEDGRTLAEFGFRVPVEKSGYRIGNKIHQSIVGYTGTFLADPGNFDLVRLVIHADRLPAELNACDSTTSFDYRTIPLNNAAFLIPRKAHWHVVNLDGTELDNSTVFVSCHEFRGQSAVRFDEFSPAVGAGSGTADLQRAAMPADLPFSIALSHAINPETAAAGDPFQATLTGAIKEKHGEILVPKGAVVTGRIMRIERLYGRLSQSLILAVKLETVELNGAPQPFMTSLKSIVKRREKLLHGMGMREELGSFHQMTDDETVGFLKFEGVTRDYVIRRGLEIMGRTAAPR